MPVPQTGPNLHAVMGRGWDMTHSTADEAAVVRPAFQWPGPTLPGRPGVSRRVVVPGLHRQGARLPWRVPPTGTCPSTGHCGRIVTLPIRAHTDPAHGDPVTVRGVACPLHGTGRATEDHRLVTTPDRCPPLHRPPVVVMHRPTPWGPRPVRFSRMMAGIGGRYRREGSRWHVVTADFDVTQSDWSQ